jgi:hypothetical protein
MTEEMRKISVNVQPPPGRLITGSFLKEVQQVVERFVSDEGYAELVESEQITLSWYDDFPVSAGVSVGVNFSVLEGVDLAGELVIAFRKLEYEVIGVVVGY